jgi:hypothetical protein
VRSSSAIDSFLRPCPECLEKGFEPRTVKKRRKIADTGATEGYSLALPLASEEIDGFV